MLIKVFCVLVVACVASVCASGGTVAAGTPNVIEQIGSLCPGTVYVEAGLYNHFDACNTTAVMTDDCWIVGAGRGETVIDCRHYSVGALFSFSGANEGALSDLTILNSHYTVVTSTTGYDLDVRNVTFDTILGTCLVSQTSAFLRVSDCAFVNGGTFTPGGAVYFNSVGGSVTNSTFVNMTGSKGSAVNAHNSFADPVEVDVVGCAMVGCHKPLNFESVNTTPINTYEVRHSLIQAYTGDAVYMNTNTADMLRVLDTLIVEPAAAANSCLHLSLNTPIVSLSVYGSVLHANNKAIESQGGLYADLQNSVFLSILSVQSCGHPNSVLANSAVCTTSTPNIYFFAALCDINASIPVSGTGPYTAGCADSCATVVNMPACSYGCALVGYTWTGNPCPTPSTTATPSTLISMPSSSSAPDATSSSGPSSSALPTTTTAVPTTTQPTTTTQTTTTTTTTTSESGSSGSTTSETEFYYYYSDSGGNHMSGNDNMKGDERPASEASLVIGAFAILIVILVIAVPALCFIVRERRRSETVVDYFGNKATGGDGRSRHVQEWPDSVTEGAFAAEDTRDSDKLSRGGSFIHIANKGKGVGGGCASNDTFSMRDLGSGGNSTTSHTTGMGIWEVPG